MIEKIYTFVAVELSLIGEFQYIVFLAVNTVLAIMSHNIAVRDRSSL